MSLKLFHRWHPTLALRYLPMLKYISSKDKILEVGSGTLGIGPYLGKGFTGVDVEFKGPNWPKMKKVEASATKLPFKDNSFDVVINSDMLEHLPQEKRQLAINEMMRVCKKTLIIGVPIGNQAHLQDKALDQIYLQVHGARHPFLEEQTEFGLPSHKEISQSIKTAANKFKKSYQLSIIPNLNLSLRMWLMKGWISKNPITNIFFRKILLLFIPILRLFNQDPVYRKIFVIQINRA
jgi:predicted SAM-dependent methyltransferase